MSHHPRRRGDACPRAAFLFAFLIVLPGREAAGQRAVDYHRRADAALEAFLLNFWSDEIRYLRHEQPGDLRPTFYWNYAQGLDAALDGVERTGRQKYDGFADLMIREQLRRRLIVSHYDDENWMALAFLRAAELREEPSLLNPVIRLFEDIRSGWDETCCGSRPGGIWWDKAHTQKATAANAGPVITAVRLFKKTGDPSYLEFAERVYDFWFENMVNSRTFQVTDHINPDGAKVFWVFTYNEGLMIGASVELFSVTEDPRYLENAENLAEFMITREVRSTRFGPVLSDGSNSVCGGDCHAFKGIAYRYLLELWRVTGDERYFRVLRASADAIWNLARNSGATLFSVDWTGPSMFEFSEPEVASATMALNLFADAIGPYPESCYSSMLQEAEDASTLVGRSVEATPRGFTGWGYVPSESDGDEVTFVVDVEATGSHELSFRYAAGAGEASRSVKRDGVRVAALQFPATDSWRDYETASVVVPLREGASRIGLLKSRIHGDSARLQLDHLRVRRVEEPGPSFRRGDASVDGVVDIGDVSTIFRSFLGLGPCSGCAAAADSDGGGFANLQDAEHLFSYLFEGGPPPAEPGPRAVGLAPGGVDCRSYEPSVPSSLAEFALSLDGPTSVVVPAGGPATFEVLVLLDAISNTTEEGAGAWSISLGAENLRIVGVSLDGTWLDEQRIRPVLEKSEPTDTLESGAVSSVVLSVERNQTLPPTGVVSIAALRVEADAPGGGTSRGRLFFAGGKRGPGLPVENRVALAGVSHVPAFAPALEIDIEPGNRQLPGDCNQDSRLDLSDAMCLLGFLFVGEPQSLPCGGGSVFDRGNIGLLDWQPDGGIDLTDVVALLGFLFQGVGAPHPLAIPTAGRSNCVQLPECPDVAGCR